MPTSLGFRFPAPGDSPDVAGDIQRLAGDVDDYLANAGWQTLTPSSGYRAVGAATPQYCVKGGVLYFRGLIEKTSGSFATSTDIVVVAAGGVSGVSNQKNRQLASSSADVSCRGFINSDGSVHFGTGAAVGSYYDISGFSGIVVGS